MHRRNSPCLDCCGSYGSGFGRVIPEPVCPCSDGDPGPTSPTGAAVTITIGSVITTGPDGNAEVINSGTDEDAVFDFVIPAGPTGPGGGGIDASYVNVINDSQDMMGITTFPTNVNLPTVVENVGFTQTLPGVTVDNAGVYLVSYTFRITTQVPLIVSVVQNGVNIQQSVLASPFPALPTMSTPSLPLL